MRRVAIAYQASLCPFAIAPCGLECHTALYPFHEIASFGIKRQQQFPLVWLVLVIATQGTQGHVPFISTRGKGLVVYGKDTTVQFLVVTVEILLSLFVDKPVPAIFLRMHALEPTPVELPPCISPQFVISSILYHAVKCEEAVSPAIPHLHQLALHKVAIVVEQFDVQHSTYLRRLVVRTLSRVGSKPYGISQAV